MITISDTAVLTVGTRALRTEITTAIKALNTTLSEKLRDRQEMVNLKKTDDPMMDQAAEDHADVQTIQAGINQVQREVTELRRFKQALDMHSRDTIDIAYDPLDRIIEIANQARSVEALGNAEASAQAGHSLFTGKD